VAGQKTAADQYGLGADIILPIAGFSDTDVYAATAEKGDGYWVIGADTTQDHLAPGIITDLPSIDGGESDDRSIRR
jgi:basic membrane lipoprotein Med (substrate-binding protein (PBP1-ABC) superfamily)